MELEPLSARAPVGSPFQVHPYAASAGLIACSSCPHILSSPTPGAQCAHLRGPILPESAQGDSLSPRPALTP